MNTIYDQTFSNTSIDRATYDNCIFIDCDFSIVELNDYNFVESRFVRCNFTNTNIANTGMKDVVFEECKMLGLDFQHASPFLLKLDCQNCMMHYANFTSMSLKLSTFIDCDLTEADFTSADLSGINLSNCNMGRAIFDNSILEKTNFKGSINISFHPAHNKIKGALIPRAELGGLVTVFGIKIV